MVITMFLLPLLPGPLQTFCYFCCHHKTVVTFVTLLPWHYKPFVTFCYFVTLLPWHYKNFVTFVTLAITNLLSLFELCCFAAFDTLTAFCEFVTLVPWHYKTFVTFCYSVTLALQNFCYFCYFAALLLTLLPDFACFVTHFACLIPSPSLPAPTDPAIQMACLRFPCLRCLLSCLAMFFCGRVFSNSKIKPKRDIVDTKTHAFCAF